MEETRNVYRILVGKPDGKRPLGLVGDWTWALWINFGSTNNNDRSPSCPGHFKLPDPNWSKFVVLDSELHGHYSTLSVHFMVRNDL
jgi:hypothetical protein